MVILIDNGHGYNTSGKYSPLLKNSGLNIDEAFIKDGRFKEYLYTRFIAKDIVDILKSMDYDARLLTPEDNDISLTERVNRVNKICNTYGAGNVLLISIHANAIGDGNNWMTGKGWEAYTTRGTTNSDKLASFLYKRAHSNFENRSVREDWSDGDADKESDFYIIKKANCPAVLTENFFFSSKEDLKYMTSDEGLHAVVRTHVEGIIDYIESKK